jgi:hypothetical protein
MQRRFNACLTILALGLAFTHSRLAIGEPPAPAAERSGSRLQIGKLPVGKILILGNSITLHGPAPDIGWNGNWGMAASAADKDYVHLLTEQIAKSTTGRPAEKPTANKPETAKSEVAMPKLMVKNIADFERQLDKYDLRAGLKPELDFAADLVIVAIGENVAALTTDEAKARFAAAFAGLLAELKRHGHPALFVRSSFWPDAAKDEIMRQACANAGGVFVDIGKLGGDESNFARSERKIDHAGVAGHPGDKGMQAIADALWAAIQNFTAKP